GSASLTEPPQNRPSQRTISGVKPPEPMSRLRQAMSARFILRAAMAAAIVAAIPATGVAQTATRGETYSITRAKGPIVIDGNLSDEGWQGAVRIERWYEMNPGDNIEPKLKNVGYLTYDN